MKTFALPVPVFHSPKATVLLVPSVMSRMPKLRPDVGVLERPVGRAADLLPGVFQARAHRGEVVVARGPDWLNSAVAGPA